MAWLWLIAGPNGAGKTTLLRRGFLQAAITGLPAASLSADVLTAHLVEAGVERDTANLGSANLVDGMLASTVDQGRSVIVETVLSSGKYLPVVHAARSRGTLVGLVYVSLRGDIDHLLRVRSRAAQGGHDVDPRKIIERRARSHANLGRFAPLANVCLVFDNSEIARPVLVAEGRDGRWTIHHRGRLPDLDPVLSELAA